MTAPTLDELRRLRCELAPSKLAVSTAVKALLDCEIARREEADQPSGDGLKILYEAGKLENDHLRAKLAAAEKERDAAINRADSYACERCGIRTGIDAVVPHDVWNKLSPNSDETGLLCLWCMDSIAAERGIVAEVELHWGGGRALKQADAAPSTVAVDCLRQTIQHLAAKLKDAERKRDEWERGYDAMSAEVAKIRTALVGLTLPRADLTAEVEALREALRVEREACDRAAGLIDDDESESRRQWRREYDARRAAEKAKP